MKDKRIARNDSACFSVQRWNTGYFNGKEEFATPFFHNAKEKNKCLKEF